MLTMADEQRSCSNEIDYLISKIVVVHIGELTDPISIRTGVMDAVVGSFP